LYKINHFLILYNPQHISKIIGAKLIGAHKNAIKHLLIDSRQLTDPNHTLFVALVTSRNDAHQYILDLYKKGVTVFLVDHIPENCLGLKEEMSFLVVDDTLRALQQLASYHRDQFNIPVIGITGSNGKTIVKEWLYQLLKQDYTICRSPKSYNSQVGVPLSLWQLNQQHTLGIFEAGISEVGEMTILNQLIKPTIGVLTSLGSAHDEGFESAEEKLQEKLKLFSGCSSVIINGLSFDAKQINMIGKECMLISKTAEATLQVLEIENLFTHTIVIATYNNERISIHIPFTDAASVDNAITCWTVLLHLKVPQQEIEKRMLLLQAVAMRLELKLGNNNCILINDFYNSDINALEIALHHQKQQHRGGKKVVILSDIEQSGKLSWELYQHVAELLAQFHIDTIVGIGKEISSQKNFFCCHPELVSGSKE
jgi:UDP-N-acetylmuramoyl-tripeptide--D-alanyl-D-alanine ligase